MQAPQLHIPAAQQNPDSHTVIVIGSGPVGMRFCHEYLKRVPDARVLLIGNEPYRPYNRVQLSALLAGEVGYDEIVSTMPDTSRYAGFTYLTETVTQIDIDRRTVTDASGAEHQYQKLVFATGARAHVPSIPGVEQTGVYTFRNLKDTEHLYNRVHSARHIVVVGGGLLGIEAARALRRFNTRVTLIQQSDRVMNRQLDSAGAALLEQRIKGKGIDIITSSGVREILGESRVTGVIIRTGEQIDCDTVLLCTGIKPNIELARDARIKVGRGISVDDQLHTSAPNIYAIGECCEHRGHTYGLVNPGFEQAAIAADIIARGEARYLGSLEVSRLKVVGETVISMGQVSELRQRPRQYSHGYTNRKRGLYRRIVTHKGQLVGAIGIGDWDEARRVQEAYQSGRTIWPWQRLRFVFTGRLFGKVRESHVSQWPATAIVCQCNGITQGSLLEACEKGADTVVKLQEDTGAGTVCGSCKPLLADLTGQQAQADKDASLIPGLVSSLTTIALIGVFLFTPGLTVADSVLEQGWFEGIWNDKFYKQVTGFTLLGLSAIGLILSARKRLNLSYGKYSYWRTTHIVIGMACAALLYMHTGLHKGDNLNFLLLADFLAILALGALTGTAITLAQRFSMRLAGNLRKQLGWAHILLAWPLPVLIAIHILTVYYF